MQIKVFKNFSKRVNSTKQPTGGTTVNVQLKDNCSIEAPVFILSGVDTAINYVNAFGRYYYVEDYTILDGHRSQLSCVCDLLATAKSDIKSGTAMVRRSSSNFNGAMRDNLVSISALATKSFVGATSIPFSTTGCFVINVASSGSPMGSTRAYILDSDNMATFSKWICGDSTDPNFTAFETWALATFGNIFGAIMGCKWLPISYASLKSYFSITEVNVHVAKWDVLTVQGLAIISAIYKDVATIDISDVFNPNDFRKMPPYSNYEIFLPYYGVLSLDAIKLNTAISVTLSLDPRTGDLFYEAFSGESVLFSVTLNCATEIPVAQVTMFRQNNIQAIQASVPTMFESGGVSALSSILAGDYSVISAAMSPTINVRGNIGGSPMSDETSIYVIATILATTEPVDLEATYGRALEACIPLSSLSGYVQTYKASISTNLQKSETEQINALLDDGIYIE